MDIIRRDEEGEEDFAIRLQIVQQDRKLPDPRARLVVSLDYEDPLAAALVTRGLPLNQPRTLSSSTRSMNLTLTWDRRPGDGSRTTETPTATADGSFHAVLRPVRQQAVHDRSRRRLDLRADQRAIGS